MNCPNCERENVEIFTGLIKGKPLSNTIANFCKRCGADLRPYHENIIKHSNLKPIPKD